mgnify:CR=1 FL=1
MRIVTGDTKVVDRGKGDGVYINTSGVGVLREGVDIRPGRAQPGDVVLVSGEISTEAWVDLDDLVRGDCLVNPRAEPTLADVAAAVGLTEQEALARRSAPNAIERAIRATADWAAIPGSNYQGGSAFMRQEARIGFQGWRIASFTTHASVRERVLELCREFPLYRIEERPDLVTA